MPYSFTVFFITTRKGVVTWKINIRGDEHNPPHFHAVWGQKEISFEIETLKKMESTNVKEKEESVIKSFVEDKKDELLEKFFEINPNLKPKGK